jgi:signal peptidase I
VLERLKAARRKPLFEVALIAALAVLLAVAVQAYAVKPYQIPSESMEPTLDVGQRVIVNRLSMRLGDDPDPGDIVVFHPPTSAERAGQSRQCESEPALRRDEICPNAGSTSAETTFIKRVVAGPGDRLKIIDGAPVVNGRRFESDWQTIPCRSCDYPKAITLPANQYFMMGDNRPESDDSRFWGPVPRDWIIGEAVFTYWPPGRIGSL